MTLNTHAFLASHYVNMASGLAVTRATAILARDGLVTFDGVHDRESVVSLAGRLLSPREHRDADADGVTIISERGSVAGQLGYAGFGAAELEPHTESSALAQPPRFLMLVCALPADHGGESYVVDGAAIYSDLAAHSPRLLQALQEPATVRFGNPGYWGSVFEPTLDGRIRIRLRLDGLEHFTEPAAEAVPLLRAVISKHVRELPLRRGQGYLLDNWRMLHGRRSFQGPRLMYRILGDLVADHDFPLGFQPPNARAAA
ncbi:TauD/TfdA family dioxygenase [Nonomuraea purpurea]|uniref:TauD/TfdA family dioxygenase n=1 Tax=Nonomuraea purpurea TaxID=1849276 RepID=A0ABV8G8A0_9ACTN